MNVVRIKAKIQWKAFRDPATAIWVAVCEPLKLTVQGDTWRNLMETISDTLELVFKELLASGDLETFLGEHGWRRENEIPTRSARVRFDIPFQVEPQARRRYDSEGALC